MGRVMSGRQGRLLTGVLDLLVVGVLATTLHATPAPAPSAAIAAANGRDSRAQIVDLLDSRRETMKTIEAARESAEQDLREALQQDPPDEARIGALVAEIANFSDELSAVEAQTQSQIRQLLSNERGRTLVRF